MCPVNAVNIEAFKMVKSKCEINSGWKHHVPNDNFTVYFIPLYDSVRNDSTTKHDAQRQDISYMLLYAAEGTP